MVNLFSIGCHVIDRAYLRVYRLSGRARGDYQKEERGVSGVSWQIQINVVIDWQLSKQGIRWPVSLDRIEGSGVDQSRSSIFFKSSAGKLLVFKSLQAPVYFFLIDMKYVVFMCRTIRILISTWPRTGKFRQLLQAGKTVVLTLLTMVTRWSRSTSNFYALIDQNLVGEFMRKIYAASWILFTLTAEADRVLCQLVMFLTVFFHLMYKMKCSCYQESSVVHG